MTTEADIPYTPTLDELERAREAFQANEPRDLFYRAAMELVEHALHRTMEGSAEVGESVSLAEALAVLLRTWNQGFYRLVRRFDHGHLCAMERLLAHEGQAALAFRSRSIDGVSEGDASQVERIFPEFERILGPVAAAKALHLLAPRFFPLWDQAIASKGYHIGMKRMGENAQNYCRLMRMAKQQWQNLGGELGIGRNPLKAVDEFNYCTHTRRWMHPRETSRTGA